MNNAEQQWEAMSDTKKIEFLATRIMGWRRTSDGNGPGMAAGQNIPQ